jgi:hypothetical protein
MDVVVLKDWVTLTKVTLLRSNTSTSLAKSINDRDMSRDNLDENGGGNQGLKRRPVAKV